MSATPLAGVKVLEFSHTVMGPTAGLVFAEFGADVIKVEQPGTGDPLRTWGARRHDVGLVWKSVSRNKKCVTADLRTDDGRALLHGLLASATSWCSTPGPAHSRVGVWTTSRCTHGTRSWWCCT